MYLTHFTSLWDYGRFAWAREFENTNNHTRYVYQKTISEQLGDLLVAPFLKPIDVTVRHMYDPKVIISTVMIALAVITMAYYPEKTVDQLKKLMPKAYEQAPVLLRGGIYTLLQLTIVGLGMRTWGRLDPRKELLTNWQAGTISTVPLGAHKA